MTFVRTHTGEKIVCGWDDCQKPGHDETRVMEPAEDGGKLIYLFCSDRHKLLFVNSHQKRGFLPTGSRGVLT